MIEFSKHTIAIVDIVISLLSEPRNSKQSSPNDDVVGSKNHGCYLREQAASHAGNRSGISFRPLRERGALDGTGTSTASMDLRHGGIEDP